MSDMEFDVFGGESLSENEHSDDSNAEIDGESLECHQKFVSVVQRILATSDKKTKDSSRDKKNIKIPSSKKRKVDLEIVDIHGKSVPDGNQIEEKEREKPKLKFSERKQTKYLKENLCRVKPENWDRERERTLTRIATKGVVQLFNAVEQQQKSKGNTKKTKSTSKKSISMVKGSFIDKLRRNINQEVEKEEVKQTTEESKSWNVLKDDFMMGATLKDWDKDE